MNDSNEIEAIVCIIAEALECFLKSPSPVLYVDACFAGNQVKLLSACFMDMDHHIQSIALYVCGEENINHYITFFSLLLKAGMINKDFLILMTDFGTYFEESIKATFMAFMPNSFRWCLCYEHHKRDLADFISKHYPENNHEDADVFKFCERNLYFATRAGTEDASKKYLDIIKNSYPDVYDYIKTWKWLCYRHTINTPQYNQFSNNVSESFNSMMLKPLNEAKSIRESSVYNIFNRFVYITYTRLELRYVNLALHDRQEGIRDFPDPIFGQWVTSAVAKIGYSYIVLKYMYTVNIEENSVYDKFWNDTYIIDLDDSSCSCGLYYHQQFPCIHMIALLHERKEYYRVADFISDCYKRRKIQESCCKLTEGWYTTIQNKDSSRAPNVDKYEGITFSFWASITSITKRLPSRGEEVLTRYTSRQGKKLISQTNMNR